MMCIGLPTNGNMIPLDEDILFIGWFNQQPVLPTKDEWEFYLCIILQHLTSSF